MSARPATLVMSASTRTGSLNGGLARRIVTELHRREEPVELVDLTEYEMPMYHGDIEREAGAPDAAAELVERFAAAEHLVIVTPEYNGAFPPLLKNTFDWMSRVDRGFLTHLTVHLAAASPGSRGGAGVLGIMRTWLEHMRATVAEEVLSVPKASLDAAGELVTEEPVDLEAFLPG